MQYQIHQAYPASPIEASELKYIALTVSAIWLIHPELDKSCVTTLVSVANSISNQTLTIFGPLTSSDVLILIAKVKLNVLYKAVYLSRSIRPNKHPRIKCKI